MTSITLTTKTTGKIAKGSPLFFAMPQGKDAASFTAGQTVSLQVYGRLFTGLVTTFSAVIAVTWPTGAPYDLPPGEYNIQFDLVGGDPLPSGATQVAKQDPAAAADVAALKAQFDTLLANMKAAKIMAS
jgi:hypothetical protein